MNRKKAYVSPQVMRVKLEPTQAVLSHCEVGQSNVSQADPTGFCDAGHACKARKVVGTSNSHALS